MAEKEPEKEHPGLVKVKQMWDRGEFEKIDRYGRSLGILAWLPQSGDPERLDEALITSGLAFPRSS